MNRLRNTVTICFFLLLSLCALFMLSLFVPFELSTRLRYNSDIALQSTTAKLSHDSDVWIAKRVDKEPILAILNRAHVDHAVKGALSNTFYGTDAGFFTLFIDGVSLEISEEYMLIHHDPPRNNEYVRLLNGEAENLWNCLSDSYFLLNP